MFKVTIWDEERIQDFDFPVSEIEPFIRLVKKYGFMSKDGVDYVFDRAQVDSDGSVTIYVNDPYA